MTREEVFLRAPDHVAALVVALIDKERRVEAKPLPDGWWRVRGWMPEDSTLDPKPLASLASSLAMHPNVRLEVRRG